MKTIKIFKLSSLLLFALIATQSCMVSSLYPLHTDKDRIHLEELNGVWIDNDETRYKITTVVDSTGLKSGKETKIQNEDDFFNSGGIEDPKIWKEIKKYEKKKEILFFFPALRKHYQIQIISKQDTSLFIARLSKLNDHYFLDIMPDEDHLEKKLDDDYIISLVVPMHGFFKLEFIEEKLKLNWIFSEDFKELRKNKKIRLAHTSRGDRKIITAKTSDIQKFLIKFADSELFNNHKDAELILSPLK